MGVPGTYGRRGNWLVDCGEKDRSVGGLSFSVLVLARWWVKMKSFVCTVLSLLECMYLIWDGIIGDYVAIE